MIVDGYKERLRLRRQEGQGPLLGRVQDWPKPGALASDARCRAKFAHVGQHSSHVLAGHELADAVKAPAGREVGVLVEEIAPVDDLELVDLRTQNPA